MKKITLVVSSLLILNLFYFTAAAQKGEQRQTIEGNGKLVTRNIPVQAFTELKASGVYELKLAQGAKEEVKIEADENLQELFTIRNDGQKLIIAMDKEKNKNRNIKSKNKIKVYVTFKQLKDVELSTIGNVTADNKLQFNDLDLHNKSVGHIDLDLNANKINLDNESVGNITLTGKAQNAVLKNSGVGNIKAGDFVVQTMTIDNNGVGNAEVNAAKELKVTDSFLGKVKNKGAAPVRKKNKVVI
jgi:hypothetical protein